jgi:hypothetical protein
VPGVRGARARAMLGRSRLEVTAIGGVSGPISDPRKSLTTVVAERTKQAGASCIVTRSVPPNIRTRVRSRICLSIDRHMANGVIDGWIGRRRQGNKSPPPAAYVHLRMYIQRAAHILYYMHTYVARLVVRIIPSRGSKVNWDFKESETWPGGPDRPSLVNVVLYFDY